MQRSTSNGSCACSSPTKLKEKRLRHGDPGQRCHQYLDKTSEKNVDTGEFKRGVRIWADVPDKHVDELLLCLGFSQELLANIGDRKVQFRPGRGFTDVFAL